LFTRHHPRHTIHEKSIHDTSIYKPPSTYYPSMSLIDDRKMCFGSGLNTSEVIERSVAWSIDRSRWSWMKKKALEETTVLSWLLKQHSLTHRPRCLAVVITVTVV
ncbi:unnamed protein product, partial [Brassica napus]